MDKQVKDVYKYLLSSAAYYLPTIEGRVDYCIALHGFDRRTAALRKTSELVYEFLLRYRAK